MRPIEIDIIAFGKFSNMRIELSEDINIINGCDEAGKTMLTAFIFAMLFGIDKPDVSHKDDLYTTYLPAEHPEKYGGLMVFEHDGKLYRITKYFHESKHKSELFCITQNRVVEDGGKVFQEMLVGLTYDEYVNMLLLDSGWRPDMDPFESERKKKLFMEKREAQNAVDSLTEEIIEESQKLADLEDKASKVKEPTMFEKNEKEYYSHRDQYKSYKKLLAKLINDKSDEKEEEEERGSKLPSDLTAPSKSFMGMFIGAGVLLLLGIVMIVAKLTVVGILCFVGAAALAGVGFAMSAKNKKIAEELENERQRIKQEQAERKKEKEQRAQSNKEEKEKRIKSAERTKKELFDYFSKFGKIKALNDEEIAKLEEKLLAEKAERNKLREKIGAQVAEQGEKVLKLRMKFEEEEARIRELKKAAEKEREKEALQFAKDPKKVDKYIQDIKKKRGNFSQMKLAMRMAASDISLNMFEMPLIFDDVFEYLDDERMSKTLIEVCSRKGQKIILTCRDKIAEILDKYEMKYKMIVLE